MVPRRNETVAKWELTEFNRCFYTFTISVQRSKYVKRWINNMNDNLNKSDHYINYNYYNTMTYKNYVKYLKSILIF